MKTAFLFFAALLTGSVLYGRSVSVTVINPDPSASRTEILEIPWKQVLKREAFPDTSRIVVVDAHERSVPFQFIREGGQKIQSILFPVRVSPGGKTVYRIRYGTPESFTGRVYGRFVPERKDDFAWENDRIAFRVYGPALEATGEVSNGIDLWVKRTSEMVIDKWYRNDLTGTASYHTDHGEGMDFYNVGRTLGAGALAPYAADSLWLGRNFVTYEVLDSGPLRFTFRLIYAPFRVGNDTVTETRTISLDAGEQFNRIGVRFEMTAPHMSVAAGVVVRNRAGERLESSAQRGYAAYAEPEAEEKGVLYTAVVSPKGFRRVLSASGHLLATDVYKRGTEYLYYSGGGWSKGGFPSAEDWFRYVANFADRLRHPLKVKIR